MSATKLLPQHAQMLAASGIREDVIEARCYQSVETKAELRRLGFSDSQCLVPTLLVPIWNVQGERGLLHHRPDNPRLREGKLAKYELPAGGRMALDIHPFIRDKVRDPNIPLVITEGVKKGDAGVSLGLCCIAVIGTWNWRGTNEHGGKTVLPDWESIALKDTNDRGRTVYIVYDSDVMTKREVYQALVRLSEFLKSRGAHVLYIYLPHGDGGRKVGLDDFLVSGHTTDDLLALATPDLRKPPVSDQDADQSGAGPYRETDNGLIWVQPTRDGTVDRQLTNFAARIVAEVQEDDGAESTLAFEMWAKCRSRERSFRVTAHSFAAMNWPIEQLGAGAILMPGQGMREHARVAIQSLSGDPPKKHVYQHLGWRQVRPGIYVYLNAAGVIGGTTGQSEGVAPFTVQLPDALQRFSLPSPPDGQARVAAIRASLRLLDLAPDRLTVPILGGIYRSAIDRADFGIHVAGPTGTYKTELAALAQQHYGPGMDSRNLPASWSSTDNALEGLCFAAKDALLVIDDFAPPASLAEAQRLHAKSERLFRAQGNNSGRQRMRPDGTLRPTRSPRGLILSTGEDTPTGQSIRARLEVLEVSAGEINTERLSACQRDASAGLLAQSMSAFVAWLAPQYGQEQQALHDQVKQLRAQSLLDANAHGYGVAHRRTPEITANLAAGYSLFLRFAVESSAITAAEVKQLWNRGWSALIEAEAQQGQHQAANEPARRFIELLAASIASGKAHVANAEGVRPQDAQAYGWRAVEVGSEDFRHTEWRPQGDRVGWVEEATGDMYIIPDVAYSVARRLGNDGGDGLTVTAGTLRKRLRQAGYLRSTDQPRQTLTIRRTLEGCMRNVLHLDIASLMLGKPDISDKPDIQAENGGDVGVESAANVGFSMSGLSGIDQKPDIETDQKPDIEGEATHGEGCQCRECRVCQVSTTYKTPEYTERAAAPPSNNGNGHHETQWHTLDYLTVDSGMEEWAERSGFTGDLWTVTEEFLIDHRGKGSQLTEADLRVDWFRMVREQVNGHAHTEGSSHG
jgi:hypothetical protein